MIHVKFSWTLCVIFHILIFVKSESDCMEWDWSSMNITEDFQNGKLGFMNQECDGEKPFDVFEYCDSLFLYPKPEDSNDYYAGADGTRCSMSRRIFAEKGTEIEVMFSARKYEIGDKFTFSIVDAHSTDNFLDENVTEIVHAISWTTVRLVMPFDRCIMVKIRATSRRLDRIVAVDYLRMFKKGSICSGSTSTEYFSQTSEDLTENTSTETTEGSQQSTEENPQTTTELIESTSSESTDEPSQGTENPTQTTEEEPSTENPSITTEEQPNITENPTQTTEEEPSTDNPSITTEEQPNVTENPTQTTEEEPNNTENPSETTKDQSTSKTDSPVECSTDKTEDKTEDPSIVDLEMVKAEIYKLMSISTVAVVLGTASITMSICVCMFHIKGPSKYKIQNDEETVVTPAGISTI